MFNDVVCFLYSDCSSSLHFKKYQDLSTERVITVEQFSINGSLFLAFGSFGSNSSIYKLNDTTGKFSLYQTMEKTVEGEIEYFMIADNHYLAVGNCYDGSIFKLHSVIYQWNGHKFAVFQKIPANKVGSFTFFKVLQGQFSCGSELLR